MKKVRILSLDGGGFRGIIPATIMCYVEKRAQELTKNENLRIADLFDFVAGTSTGGILTCLYLCPDDNKKKPLPLYTADEALSLYEDHGYAIFNKSRVKWYDWKMIFDATKYSPKVLEHLAAERFGNKTLSQLLKPALITTYNLESENTFFFSSREEPSKKREFYIRDVARSTSAAPTYFPPAKIKNLADPAHNMINLDGGVFANNPTMCAYAEVRDTKIGSIQEPSAKNMLILSIGTGGGHLNIKGRSESNKWGLLKWAQNIPDIMMDGSADTVAYQIQSIFNSLDLPEQKKQYLRVDVPQSLRNSYSSDMADASSGNITALKSAAEQTLEAQKEAIDEMLTQFIEGI